MGTLILHKDITSWNIYQNHTNSTCITIRFSDNGPSLSPVKYRKISDRQVERNVKRAKRYQSKPIQSKREKNSENPETDTKKTQN